MTTPGRLAGQAVPARPVVEADVAGAAVALVGAEVGVRVALGIVDAQRVDVELVLVALLRKLRLERRVGRVALAALVLLGVVALLVGRVERRARGRGGDQDEHDDEDPPHRGAQRYRPTMSTRVITEGTTRTLVSGGL